MIRPERLSDAVTLYEGDCLDVLPTLTGVDAVVTDPPYGMNWDTDSTRFTGGKGFHHKVANPVIGDDVPFDPSPWLEFERVILWGANHFSQRLPIGTMLVWIKKSDEKLGVFLSDAEVAWMKGGHGVYVKRHIWDGCAREGSENNQHYHKTQKPVGLMRWCIQKTKVPVGSTILDPYAGSGTTAVAAIAEGMNCILVESDPHYCDIIRRRIADAEATGPQSLFKNVKHPELFAGMESDLCVA